MILPHPETDFKQNVLVVGADIIKILKTESKQSKYVLVDKVIDKFLKLDNKHTIELFFDSLTFLYALGFITHNGYKIKLVKNHT